MRALAPRIFGWVVFCVSMRKEQTPRARPGENLRPAGAKTKHMHKGRHTRAWRCYVKLHYELHDNTTEQRLIDFV